MEPTSQNPMHEISQYQRLLKEAQAVKGTSLGRDAWRRLKRNFAAIASLAFLVTLSLLTFFTPMLPLQSPIALDIMNRQYLTPDLSSVRLEVLDEEAANVPERLTVVLPRLESRIEKRVAKLRPTLEAEIDAEKRAQIADEIEAEEAKYETLLGTLWSEPNRMDRAMIRIRLALFGDWCLPSICGTDNLGRDLLARLFYGARVSLIVGVVATLVSLVIGVSYGATAGYLGGRVDNLMMRFVDVLYSIPFIFVVIFLITILSDDEIKGWLNQRGIDEIVIFYFVIGAIYWLTMARVVRGQVISLKNEQFVEAARTIGASRARIIFRHLVPNVMSIVIVYLTLTIPSVMLFEAFLSFLGLGVQSPNVSWGVLANDGIQLITPVRTFWWLLLFPGLALGLTLLALNFLGDGLRDALDPRLKNK